MSVETNTANQDTKETNTRQNRHFDTFSTVISVQVECSGEYSGSIHVPFTHTFVLASSSISEAVLKAKKVLKELGEI